MWKTIVRLFIKDYKNITNNKIRIAYGKLSAIIGIISNLFLAAIKIIGGVLIGSLAIIADGINNISDTGSSIITLVGFKLSNAPEDKNHPFGHQRLEYVTGLMISIFILTVGLILSYASIRKIINPLPIAFDYYIIGMLGLSIVVKVWQSYFYKKSGNFINSKALIVASHDSRNDIFATTSILISGLIMMNWDVNLDGYMGVLISIIIIINGISFIKQTTSLLIGEAPHPDYVKRIESLILGYKGVLGIHDLVIHQYGPVKKFITAHVEVDRRVDIMESHHLIDSIERELSVILNCNLVIHIDPVDPDCYRTNKYRRLVKDILFKIDPVLDFHDFRIIEGAKSIDLIFDIVVPYKFHLGKEELCMIIEKDLKLIDNKLNPVIVIDRGNIIREYKNE